MLVEEDKLDLIHDAIEDSKEKARRMVDTETLEHKEARNLSEWPNVSDILFAVLWLFKYSTKSGDFLIFLLYLCHVIDDFACLDLQH